MSIQFEVNKTFRVPQEKAYHALYDLDAANNWMQGLVRIKRLDSGEIKVGSQWKETRKMFGKEATEHFEVVRLDEPKKIVLRCDGTKGTTGKGEYVYTYTLTPIEENLTKIKLDGEIKGLSGLTKLFGKMMVGTFKKACEKDLDSLQKYLES